MSPKLHLLCVFLVLSIQGVYPGPANNDGTNPMISDVQYILSEIGRMVEMVTSNSGLAEVGASTENTQRVLTDVLALAKAWVRMLTKNVDASFKAMRCFREAIIKSVDKTEVVIKAFFDCKMQTINLTENELKTWTGTAQTFIASFSQQLKESLTLLEKCSTEANIYSCTKKNLVDMYKKVKAKLETIPATLLKPGWAIAQHIVNSAWDCKTSKWKDMVAAYNELKEGVSTCYKTHIGNIGGGNGALVLGA